MRVRMRTTLLPFLGFSAVGQAPVTVLEAQPARDSHRIPGCLLSKVSPNPFENKGLLSHIKAGWDDWEIFLIGLWLLVPTERLAEMGPVPASGSMDFCSQDLFCEPWLHLSAHTSSRSLIYFSALAPKQQIHKKTILFFWCFWVTFIFINLQKRSTAAEVSCVSGEVFCWFSGCEC